MSLNYMCMVGHYCQAYFCRLNIVFIVKFNSNSVLSHNFTIKTDFKFRFYSQYQNQFLISIIKSIPKLKFISNLDLSSKSVSSLNQKSTSKLQNQLESRSHFKINFLFRS